MISTESNAYRRERTPITLKPVMQCLLYDIDNIYTRFVNNVLKVQHPLKQTTNLIKVRCKLFFILISSLMLRPNDLQYAFNYCHQTIYRFVRTNIHHDKHITGTLLHCSICLLCMHCHRQLDTLLKNANEYVS